MSYVPTRRLTWIAWIAVGVAVAAGYVRALRGPLFALDAVVIVAALIDTLLVRGTRFEVERQVAAIFSVGRANPVAIHLRNRSSRTVRGTVTDDPLTDAIATGLPAELELAPHAGCTVRYEAIPTRRGPRDLRGVAVRYDAPLGLVARQERVELPAHVDVYPRRPRRPLARDAPPSGEAGRARWGACACAGATRSSSGFAPTSAATRSATSTGAPRRGAMTSPCGSSRRSRTRTSSSRSTSGAACGGKAGA